ncbi:DUF5123 domain-containing protein [Prolixibacter bellariivorans]|nr:DUF5123 domain-containing protein [Prolixibacter bellariivorans]
MKKNIIHTISIQTILFLCVVTVMVSSCTKDEPIYEQTRLFRPVLNQPLSAQGNAIVVNMGNLSKASSYTIELSRDTFNTVEYSVQVDSNYVVLNQDVLGDELLWNTLYQVRAKADASDSIYDSKFSDLGSVRTERFPTILKVPNLNIDVTDVEARLRWSVEGLPVTGIKVFAPDDIKLTNPLLPEFAVADSGQTSGEWIINGLQPATTYQIAIYSGATLRGWVKYTTKAADVDPNAPGVIDLTQSTDPDALVNAYATASDGDIILLKFGASYNPITTFDKSVTIQGELGIGQDKARIIVNSSANWPEGSNIDHIRFKNLYLLSNNNGGYVLYPGNNNTTVNEITFDDCYIYNLRGVLKSKGDYDIINNFNINNCYVDWIGGYGVAYTDGKTGQMIKNINYTNSTFNHCEFLFYVRNSVENVLVDGCTIVNQNNGIFRLRNDGVDVTNSWTISNCIFGHANKGVTEVDFLNGTSNAAITATNNYIVTDFVWHDDSEVPAGLVVGNAGCTQADLWANPDAGNDYVEPTDAEPLGNGFQGDFTIVNTVFPGRYDTGDPRWRMKL